MATKVESEIEDFLGGSYVKGFEDGETRTYEFDIDQCRVVDKNDFNGKPGKALVRNPESETSSWKFWEVPRVHRNVYDELKFGNNGKSWTIAEVTRNGLNRNTRYKVRGIK